MFDNPTSIRYLDDNTINQSTNNDSIRAKSAVFARKRKVVSYYFGTPLQSATHIADANLDQFITIQGDKINYLQPPRPIVKGGLNVSFGLGGNSPRHAWKIPSVIYVTKKYILITPSEEQLNASKFIYGISIAMTFLFLLLTIPFTFIFGPIFLIFSLLCISLPIIKSYLFFFKKSYISVAPIEVIKNINVDEKTITVDGFFNTGIPSFLKYKVSAELYVGDNISFFRDNI